MGLRRSPGDGLRRFDVALGSLVPALQARGLPPAHQHWRGRRLADLLRGSRGLLLRGRTVPVRLRQRRGELEPAPRPPALSASVLRVDRRRRRDARGDAARRCRAGQDADRPVPQVHDDRHVQVLPPRLAVHCPVRPRRPAQRSALRQLRAALPLTGDVDRARHQAAHRGDRVPRPGDGRAPAGPRRHVHRLLRHAGERQAADALGRPALGARHRQRPRPRRPAHRLALVPAGARQHPDEPTALDPGVRLPDADVEVLRHRGVPAGGQDLPVQEPGPARTSTSPS